MISAVIVLYHPDLNVLQRLLISLTGQVHCVIAVDNTPDSVNPLPVFASSFGGSLTHISLGQNKGIGEAQNVGIRESIKVGCSHVLLLDQDSALSSGMVAKMLAAEDRLLRRGEKVAAVSPQIVDEKTGERPSAVYYRWLRVHEVHFNAESAEPIRTDNLIASGSLIRTAALRSLGMMRSDLFIEYVDTEWVFRANSAGYSSYCIPGARMMHSFGEAAKKVWGKDLYVYNEVRYYYKLRNAVYLARLKSMGWQWRAYIASRIPYHFLVYSCLSADRARTVQLLFKALLDGMHGRLGELAAERNRQ